MKETVYAWLAAINPWIATAILALFNTAMGMLYFALGWQCRWEWLGHIFRVDLDRVARVKAKAQRYGAPAALFSGVPVVGTPIAVSLGILHVSPRLTAFFMLVGKGAKYGFIVFAIGLAIG